MGATLTKAAIDAAVAKVGKGERVELIDDSEPGLRIRIGERGAEWSVQVHTRLGKKTRIALGAWPTLGIKAARDNARNVKLRVKQGADPNAAKRAAAKAAETEARNRRRLGDLLDEYDAAKLAHLRRGAATRRALDGKRGLLRELVNRDPRSITRADIADAVRSHAKGAPIAANRSLAYANAFFNWCVEEGRIEANPARTVKKPAKEKQRDRFHSLDELREIWEAAGTLGYPFGPLYRLLIVLPMRREEIAAMPVVELDLGSDDDPTRGVWTLPAARTKRANALRVPLSPLARSIINGAIVDPDRPKETRIASGRPKLNPFVFSTTGETSVSGFAKAKRRLDKAIAVARAVAAGGEATAAMPHWTIHDLRTTFNTHACELLNIDAAVADRILNHAHSATTSKIMRVYNKSELFERRKAALCAWAALIEADILGKARGNVIPLAGGVAA